MIHLVFYNGFAAKAVVKTMVNFVITANMAVKAIILDICYFDLYKLAQMCHKPPVSLLEDEEQV